MSDDTISCDVCMEPVPTDAIYIVPDERTVCKACHDLYRTDPVAFEQRDQEVFDAFKKEGQ